MRVDCHTHSKFSSDGRLPVEEMTQIAIENGLNYLAITDHIDFDAILPKNRAPEGWRQPDVDAYYDAVRKMKPVAERNGLYLAFGAEMGFDSDNKAQALAADLIERLPFDVIINSVHFAGGLDPYYPEFFEGRTKKEAYGIYLDTVYDSLFANYHFDIVGHLGYCTRMAPYADKEIGLDMFGDALDRILLRIIETDKTLELNTNHGLCPNEGILRRYYELGGRNVSFGSDAHNGGLCDKWDTAVERLKKIGFKELSVYKAQKRESILI